MNTIRFLLIAVSWAVYPALMAHSSGTEGEFKFGCKVGYRPIAFYPIAPLLPGGKGKAWNSKQSVAMGIFAEYHFRNIEDTRRHAFGWHTVSFGLQPGLFYRTFFPRLDDHIFSLPVALRCYTKSRKLGFFSSFGPRLTLFGEWERRKECSVRVPRRKWSFENFTGFDYEMDRGLILGWAVLSLWSKEDMMLSFSADFSLGYNLNKLFNHKKTAGHKPIL